MRKTIIILTAVAILGIGAAYLYPGGSEGGAAVSTTKTKTASSANSSASTSSASAATQSGTLKDGTYTGNTASNQFDDIQVAVTISSGKITSVNTPVARGDSDHSDQINSYALPKLVSQTLQSQSANLDGVSGASYTSQAYTESLQSALDQAAM